MWMEILSVKGDIVEVARDSKILHRNIKRKIKDIYALILNYRPNNLTF